MIVEYIRYTVEGDRVTALIEAYDAAGDLLLASPHCEGYDVAQCVDEPESVVVRIHWDSADGHLTGFRQSPDFSRFLALVRPFFAAITEMRHYRPVAGRLTAEPPTDRPAVV